MPQHTSKTLATGFGYLEAPRWHQGRLWASDLQRRQIVTVLSDGETEIFLELPSTPIGLGFVGDTLLAVSSDTMELLHIESAAVAGRDDLRSVALVSANDMAVDAHGRAYISHFGYDLFGGEGAVPTGLIKVDPDGSVSLAGSELTFPNGVAITADGRRLVVAESFAYRISTFDIGADGDLTDHQVLVQFGSEQEMVDGICVDSEGAVWVGLPLVGEFRRVDSRGVVTDVVRPEVDSFTVACALGGPELRTLYMVVADTSLERLADNWGGDARVEVLEVDVPGVQRT